MIIRENGKFLTKSQILNFQVLTVKLIKNNFLKELFLTKMLNEILK